MVHPSPTPLPESSPAVDLKRAEHDAERRAHLQEGVVMALYTSVILLAALLTLPDDYDLPDYAGLPLSHDPSLYIIIWGGTVGLVAAHWFAFVLAASGFRHGLPGRHELEALAAQGLGAAIPALAASIVVALRGNDHDIDAAAFAPAVIIGIAGYLAARGAPHSRVASAAIGLVSLMAAFFVALLKAKLVPH